MAFGQYSAPPPAEERQCPQCGETMPAPMDVCWLCLHKRIKEDAAPSAEIADTAIQAEPLTKRKQRRQPPSAVEGESGTNRAWAVFFVLAVILSVAFCYEMPGLLLVILIPAVPIAIWIGKSNSQATRQSEESGATSARTQQVRDWGVSPSALQTGATIGLAILIGLAGIIGFVAICVAHELRGHH